MVRKSLGNHKVYKEQAPSIYYQADLATERERQFTTARANQTTGLTNGIAANWALEAAFSPFRTLFASSTDVPVLLLNQPIIKKYKKKYTFKINSRTTVNIVIYQMTVLSIEVALKMQNERGKRKKKAKQRLKKML